MVRSKGLKELARATPEGYLKDGTGETRITGLTYDSRSVEPGFLFLAVPGERFDGHAFLDRAVASGAAAVVIQADRVAETVVPSVPTLIVPNVRAALGPIAGAFYDFPTRALYLAGVTGTNGKTTVTRMIDSIARAAGERTGTVGTLGATVAGEAIPHDRTTPEAPDLQRLFAGMRAAGAVSAVMEVSSHALVSGRVTGCAYDVGVFTNLTQDHLDFHGTMEAYRDAKGLLFTEYADAAREDGKKFVAVLNVGSDAGRYYATITRADRTITYATDGPADIRATEVHPAIDAIRFVAETPNGRVPIDLPFGGRFNVENALAAIGYGIARGLAVEVIARGLSTCPPVPGRFEPVRVGQEFAVLVDYAHTPDGLENVLTSARPLTPGRLIAVFGCGGNRDRTKRPIMGGIATRLADIVVVTSDNPRREEPEAIIDEIFTGMAVGGTVYREADRRKAIALAVGIARAGDTVVIAGKGHEDYQILGDETIHFSDVEVAGEELRNVI
ncbi:MAG: UDP-N-acetylmuramoyl-L-alanyl-D-glutamate--2,6-diaminopimelate ligase [Capsulimonadales bacterium]|nr:UDP-N-acetylmuramoyl-L-alanyl-D-glutamate--2,6-diaminopimelate ligase [Capsulimonadales bacterium]